MRPRHPDWRWWTIEGPTILIVATSVRLILCGAGLLLRWLLGLEVCPATVPLEPAPCCARSGRSCGWWRMAATPPGAGWRFSHSVTSLRPSLSLRCLVLPVWWRRTGLEGEHERRDTSTGAHTAAEVRATLHRLVEALPEGELAAAQRLLEELAGIQPSGPRDDDQA